MSDRGRQRGRGRGRGRGRSGTRGDQGGIKEQRKVPGQQQHNQNQRDRDQRGGIQKPGGLKGKEYEERGRHDGESGRGGGERSHKQKQSQDGGRGDHKSNQGEDRQSQISSKPLTLEPADDFPPSPPHPTDGSLQTGQTVSHQTPKMKSHGDDLLTPPKSKESSPGDQDSMKKSSVRKLGVSSQPTPPRSTGSSPGGPENISKKVTPISSQQIPGT